MRDNVVFYIMVIPLMAWINMIRTPNRSMVENFIPQNNIQVVGYKELDINLNKTGWKETKLVEQTKPI